MSLAELGEILQKLPPVDDPKVLVGTSTADDAGVYLLDGSTAIIQTVDFFTPIVDDPYTYGEIAAANSLSDVYAMGGKPLCALNIVGFHTKHFPLAVLAEILRGGGDKAKEAGVPVLGGHTIMDEELKYGMAVTGIVHPDRIISNADARVGDVLILTKPVGTGIVTTAPKAGAALDGREKRAFELMSTLNDVASRCMVEIGAHAATDITGFGLLGHGHELAKASGVALRILYEKVPKLEGALELAGENYVPGGTNSNRYYLQDAVQIDASLTWEESTLLFDAQTSGGLLISVSSDGAEPLLGLLKTRGVSDATIIGEVVQGEPGKMFVER